MKKGFLFIIALAIVIAITSVAIASQSGDFEKEHNTNNTQELMYKAFEYSKVNQNKKAIELCDKILTIEPNNEEAYVIKILSLNKSQKPKEAIDVLDEAIKNVPNSSILNLQKGMLEIRKSNLKEALLYLTKSAEIEPTEQAYMLIAGIYSEMHEHQKAIDAYTKVIKLNPKLVKAYMGRAKDCGDIGNYKCSLENYEILKKMYPDNPLYYFMTSLYKTNTKDLDGAMVDIDKAISMTKKPDSTFLSQKAWVYLEKKEYDNAIEYLRKSLKIDKNNGYALGLYLFMADDNEDYMNVIKISRKLLKVDPDAKYNHALYATYAKALYKTGKKKQALVQIEKAIELEPSDKEHLLLKDKMQKGEAI